MKLIESCGKTPYLLPYIENGKAYHVKGFLNKFKTVVDHVTKQLNFWSEKAPEFICLDSSNSVNISRRVYAICIAES